MLGTPFELLEVTDDIHQDNAKGTTKIVGDFLILQDWELRVRLLMDGRVFSRSGRSSRVRIVML